MGVEITGNKHLKVVLKQSNKAIRIARCLRDTIWKNKYMPVHRHWPSKVNKTIVRLLPMQQIQVIKATAIQKDEIKKRERQKCEY